MVNPALAGVAQLVGTSITGSIPGKDACLGCRFTLGWGAYERQQIDVSLSH